MIFTLIIQYLPNHFYWIFIRIYLINNKNFLSNFFPIPYAHKTTGTNNKLPLK